jgi:hypothetical protein
MNSIAALTFFWLATSCAAASADEPSAGGALRIGVFQVDATPPLGTPVAYAPARKIEDPLSARGVVLLGADQPIVLCAVDWISISNGGHDAWRQALAEAAGTAADRVAVHVLHQHDGVRCDFTAEELLAPQGLAGKRFDVLFVRKTIENAAQAVKESLAKAQPVTHLGVGEARVEKVASNRRILGRDGRVAIARSSSYRIPEPILSRLNAEARRQGYELSASRVEEALAAPEGVIDPLLRMLTFYEGDQPLVSLSYYATHPQSYFGQGDVTAEFVGLARTQHEQAHGGRKLVHFNGACGNVAAGKYNDGTPVARVALTGRMADAMQRAWEATKKVPLSAAECEWRVQAVRLPTSPHLDADKLRATLADAQAAEGDRLAAAGKLAFLLRAQHGDPIELSCLKLGNVYVLHMPGELFVEYQLAAQQMRPGDTVCMAAYGDCGTGYIGTRVAYAQGGYETQPSSSNTAPQVERVLLDGVRALLKPPTVPAHPLNAWVKRTPLPDAPVSPRLGYEGACVWDSRHQLLVRYGGHNQGGGGEQGAEVWTWGPQTAEWTLKEPNTSPPGVCCNAQNVYDPTSARYIRFPFFSGSHGWQWSRELYLNDASVWTYDLTANRWRNMRPWPAPRLAPYRCASWDEGEQVVVVFGGEGSHEGTLIYDPARNEWRWPKPAVEPDGRSGGNMAYDAARKVHVLFGSQFTDDPHTWTYDVRKNEWRDMQPESQPPTDKNDAVLTYDPIQQRVLAIVKITTGKDDDARHELQTWSYDAGGNRWQRMNPSAEPEPSSNRARQLVFAPELNLAILENCTSQPREQQIWTYRLGDAPPLTASPNAARPIAAPPRPPLAEEAVVSVLAPNKVVVSWTAPEIAPADGYHVERAVVEVWSEDQLRRLKERTPPLAEPAVGAIRRVGPFQRLTKEAIRGTEYVDTDLDLNKPLTIEDEPSWDQKLHAEHLDESGRGYRRGVFAYRIRAVDRAGAEGGPSPAVLTIPSSPQQVFSREEGTTCQLKWSPNPEQGIAGYRVYRMDGRYDKEPVSRLTDQPLAGTTFEDPAAGKAARRYYIVAVDALGQEGQPSSPVWFQREWRDFYKPFVGDWHQ